MTKRISSKVKSNLVEQFKNGALANAQRDLELAQEWFPLEEEASKRERNRFHHARDNQFLAGTISVWSTFRPRG